MPPEALSFLRDPLWQFVGAVLALAAIGLAYAQYRSSAMKRELSFGLIAGRRLIAVADELTSRVKVHLDDRPVSNVYLLEFGLKNSGSQPLRAEDFESPITIKFKNDATLLTAQVTRRSPADHPSTTRIDGNALAVSPALMNPGDYLVLQVLLSHPRPEFDVTARVYGISALSPINTGWRVSPLPFFPFSHPLNGVPLLLMTFAIMAVGFYVTGDSNSAALVAAAVAALFAISLGQWFLGQRGRNAGRYIDEA